MCDCDVTIFTVDSGTLEYLEPVTVVVFALRADFIRSIWTIELQKFNFLDPDIDF